MTSVTVALKHKSSQVVFENGGLLANNKPGYITAMSKMVKELGNGKSNGQVI